LQNIILTPEQIITEIEKVKKEDIVNLSKDIFIEKNLNFALIGPFDNKNFNNILNI